MTLPPTLIIFDCDGVLIDSEALCDRVVAATLAEQGWDLSAADCHRLFLGLTFPDIQIAAEAHLARPLGPDWVPALVTRVTQTMTREVGPIPGAQEALLGVAELGLPYRIASNSSHEEMAAKFARTGLAPLVDGRTYSAYDLIARGLRGKPDPDLFLETAAAGGADPARCLVIEDSLAGVTAATAAGMTCWAYSPMGEAAQLRQAGGLPFASMFALPEMIRSWLASA